MDWLYTYLTGSANRAVIAESVASQLPGRTNGPADVYRHILISAELTRKYGEVYANALLAGHEFTDVFSENPSNSGLDSYINAIGVQLGAYIRSTNGTWADVVSHTRAMMQASFGSTDYLQIAQGITGTPYLFHLFSIQPPNSICSPRTRAFRPGLSLRNRRPTSASREATKS
jgi:hypothetical protein